ncbi:MAG TPA: methionyl-tRNA formyltransferase, partial [Nocardioidaceae bacterium]|nr:methionyl-tRNA formyltransferase [Nocardioidaceae bacterium]
AGLLVATLDGIETGQLEERAQQDEGLTYAAKIMVEDAEVRWDELVAFVERRIRACTPAPGAWTTFEGERFELGPVEPDEVEPLPPGQLRVGKSSVHVGTRSTPVRLGLVKPFGKKEMPAADWARGVRVESGACFG